MSSNIQFKEAGMYLNYVQQFKEGHVPKLRRTVPYTTLYAY